MRLLVLSFLAGFAVGGVATFTALAVYGFRHKTPRLEIVKPPIPLRAQRRETP